MLTLVGWWIAAPILWDDGWVVARERTFAASGGFSTYYDALGVNLPLDYWVEWLHHWLAEAHEQRACSCVSMPSSRWR